jgi:hypothetical protein
MPKLVYDRVLKKMVSVGSTSSSSSSSSSSSTIPAAPPPSPSPSHHPASPASSSSSQIIKLFEFENSNGTLEVLLDLDTFPDFEVKSFNKYNFQGRISSFLKSDLSHYTQLEEFSVPGVPHSMAEVLCLENPDKQVLIFYNTIVGEIFIALPNKRFIGKFEYVIHHQKHKHGITFDFIPFLPFFKKRLDTKSPMEEVDGGGKRRRLTLVRRKSRTRRRAH